MFFAKVSTPTISWRKGLCGFFENDPIVVDWKFDCKTGQGFEFRVPYTATQNNKSWKFRKKWECLEKSYNPFYAHTLIIKKGKCNAGFLNA